MESCSYFIGAERQMHVRSVFKWRLPIGNTGYCKKSSKIRHVFRLQITYKGIINDNKQIYIGFHFGKYHLKFNIFKMTFNT